MVVEKTFARCNNPRCREKLDRGQLVVLGSNGTIFCSVECLNSTHVSAALREHQRQFPGSVEPVYRSLGW